MQGDVCIGVCGHIESVAQREGLYIAPVMSYRERLWMLCYRERSGLQSERLTIHRCYTKV
jgi:hypothetical protein